ncbi:hypothetical protein AMS68_004502 [Peltaster fructicola]|uniref:Sister chromatid cohesion protein n=1 Tax=Peltaster fructicola TaxID=286661 RepID=A0A6H0XWF2_9PEZI|nr:hypothetical protein AMS68_004502 [Peltaster fructicola]
MNGPPAQFGLQQHAQQEHNGTVLAHKVKTPTVQQALPYTPFTSIIPFDPSIIKAPASSLITAKDVRVLGTETSKHARSVLNKLSAGATRAEVASEQCQQTLRDVQRLLKSNSLTQFKFRKPLRHNTKSEEKPIKSKAPHLSEFARMIFDSVSIEISHDNVEARTDSPATSKTTTTAQSHATPNEAKMTSAAAPATNTTAQSKAKLQAAWQHNSAFTDNSVSTFPTKSAAQPSVPHTNDDGTTVGASHISVTALPDTKQQSVVRLSTGTHGTIHVDQKAKGQASVQALTTLLMEMFDAEDTIVAGDDLSHEILTIFLFQDTTDGPKHLLTQATQTRLESAIQKAASTGRLDSIPIEHLKRVQRLCDDIVRSSLEVPLQLQDGWTEAEVEEWEQRLVSADASLSAVRTLLKIMTAGCADRELQPEDLVRSLLQTMRNVAETGIVAMVETHGEKKKEELGATTKFAVGLEHHDQLLVILRGFTKALKSLNALLAKVNVDESAISSIVYMCKLLIFAENASTDRESILGVQTYEGSRRYAMDVLAKVFDRYAEQRQYIFDEVLMSLEKLPGTKQSARQFRLPDAKPIQLVSALIMQLIQTSATRNGPKTSQDDDGDEHSSGDEDDSEDDLAKDDSPSKKDQTKNLPTLVAPLDQATQGSAMYVTKTLVARALGTAKNADEPHRKLLDIFTEDFLNVLPLPEWPSAEILLRSLLRQMLAIVENKKSGVPARNFALESLSRMGSGILELQSQAQSHARGVTESALAERLNNMLQQNIDGQHPDDLLHIDGPYRIMLEYLHGKKSDGAQTHTAIGFDLLQWAQQVCNTRDVSTDPGTENDSSTLLQSRLRAMMVNPQWFETNVAYDNVSPAEGRLAALVIITSSPFCKAFSKIFSVLLTNMTSEHATVKSKSLRSVVTLIETDPAVLDRNQYILRSILRCTEDSSPIVRDAALGLVARCMVLRPQLDAKIFEHIILRTEDSAIGVRKRALKMLKDIYLRNDVVAMRSNIATSIVGRIKDFEESVVELAKQTIEEIWYQPLYSAALHDQSLAGIKSVYQAQAALLVQAVESSEEMPEALASLLHELLQESKHSKDNTAVSKRLVDVLFNGIIDSADFPEDITQGMLLQVLAVFAQASPKLLTASQLKLLEAYTGNLSTNEDLTIFRLALMILRHAMPYATGLQKDFLAKLQKDLLGTLGKLPNSEYPEVAACLWTIDGELKNTEVLVKTLCSVLSNIRGSYGKDTKDEAVARKLTRLMSLAGQFGKACDFEAHQAKIKSSIPSTKSDTAAGLIIETLAPFGIPNEPLVIRRGALESICAVCQRWPKQFLRSDVGGLFDALLKEKESSLESVFLEGLLGFFSGQEVSTTNTSDPEAGATGRERLAKTYVATDQDGATASLSQRYLGQILRLATGSVGDTALIATKLVASIVRQGLPHPKECGPSLIALETSPNAAIAQIACAEHRTMHEKHETIIEKEYMRAMDRALLYQSNVVGDTRGWTGNSPVPKLCFFWDVLRGGKAKVRIKFINNICLKLVFEPADLDFSHGPPAQLSFVRFMVENLALFDFDKTDELKLLIENLSKAFATTGTALAQSIDSEVFNMNVTSLENSQSDTHHNQDHHVDSFRLRILATSAQILLLVAEGRAFLVRCWGGQKLLNKDKNKDSSKGPTRTSNAATLIDAFVKRTEQLMQPCPDHASQIAVCRAFAEVVSTDNDVDVGSEDEDDFEDDRSQSKDPRSPSVAGTPSGRKRKAASQGATGPRKRGRPRKTPSFIRVDDDEDAEGEWE